MLQNRGSGSRECGGKGAWVKGLAAGTHNRNIASRLSEKKHKVTCRHDSTSGEGRAPNDT